MANEFALAGVLEARREEIVELWCQRVSSELGESLAGGLLRNDLPELLDQVLSALRGGRPDFHGLGTRHGEQRHRSGVQLGQLLREYRILLRVLHEQAEAAGECSFRDVVCLEETISEGMEAAALSFVREQEAARRRAIHETRQAAELLELGDAFFEVRPDWTIVRLNRRLEEMSHTPRSAALGKVLWQVWPDTAKDQSAYWKELRRCMDLRVPVTFDEYFEPLDMWTGVTAYPTSSGGVVVFLRDVTERKRVEQALAVSEDRYRSLFENMPQGCFLVEVLRDEHERVTDFRFLEVNPAFERITDMARNKAVGRTVRQLWPEVVARWMETYAAAVTKGVVVNALEEEPGGRWYATTAYAPQPGQLACLFSDVTRNVEAERALQQANEQLRAADRRKDEFLATLSHELRNPLAPILNGVYLLERAPPGSGQARRAASVIGRQVEHMTRLIDDLLDVARISRGKMTLRKERVDLREIVKTTVEDHRDLFERRRIELSLSMARDPVCVAADSTRIAQVVGNLLHNAAKFTPERGRAHVAVRGGSKRATITVSDTGAGLEASTLEQVFRPFTQGAQAIDRHDGGLGLGLALVKGLVEMHGGRVRAESSGKNRGSRFSVELPLAPFPERVAHARRAEERRVHSRRVLVIEDNTDAAASLEELIALFGHEVAVAHDGRRGLELARRFHPDVVLCDLGLPGVDGYRVAEALRADPEVRGPYLVALSGYTLPEDIERARRAGFQKHLAKPASPEALEVLLARPLGRA